MFEFLTRYQLDIMQTLSGVCGIMAVLLVVTRALSRRRRQILILMELSAMFLLIFDRLAYIYSGDMSRTGHIMVRVSNFMVFFITSEIVLAFNLYLTDLLVTEGGIKEIPRRLNIVNVLASIGMLLVVVSQFTGIIYYFDENNVYHRAPLFIVCYIIPFAGPIIQMTVMYQYRKCFSNKIFISLNIFLLAPMTASIIQALAYGLSLTNIVFVLVSVLLYIFAYSDINDTISRAHVVEMRHLENDRKSMKHLFEQTAETFIDAVEERDPYAGGHSGRVADYSLRLAGAMGLPEKECEDAYYAALLHDVGKIGLSDELLAKGDEVTDEEMAVLKGKQEAGAEILEKISEYPGLSYGARYVKERYDGTGYPAGLKGEEIPLIGRIIAVADAYDRMSARGSYQDPLPKQIIREEFIMSAGTAFDPEISKAMLRLIDADAFGDNKVDEEEDTGFEDELHCGKYRDTITKGILIAETKTIVDFYAMKEERAFSRFSAPSIIIFDSYDAHVHSSARSIAAYNYKEFCEMWFDGRYVSTNARNMEVEVTKVDQSSVSDGTEDKAYKITTVKAGDHLYVRLAGPTHLVDAVIALESGSSWAYVGLTGENCYIHDLMINTTDETASDSDRRRIADEISYIDRMESDIPNIQINSTRSQYTVGVPIKDNRRIAFHTMSMPIANLVWQCPYVIIFYSQDGKVGGPDYREYAVIKLNGEDNGSNEYVQNNFIMKKTGDFKGWDDWKVRNKEGLECELEFSRKGRKLTMTTSNLGIDITNITTISDGPDEVYISLTGDEVALTDIRVL
ncbi:MAG: HD domain-containing protein [Lachnospiraceae bacterium]|nr:HD domain-containing protein [Lachnospiraceae bacterium]